MFDINGWELLLLGLLAILVLGPERLPEYAAKFGSSSARPAAWPTGPRQQLKDEMGPEFSDIDWRAYDRARTTRQDRARRALLAPR